MAARLKLSRGQILAYRRRSQALEERLPPGGASLARAAFAGLQDSVPRSALHALHARVAGVGPDALEDAALTQVWGPRYTTYVVPAADHAIFTLSRLPETGRIRARAEDFAARLRTHLKGRRVPYGEAGDALGVHPNMLRYAALTGTVLIRWEGARQPLLWTVPPPDIDPQQASNELLRRYLHAYGPSSLEAFVRWAGADLRVAAASFEALAASLLHVRTPIGEAWILDQDEQAFRETPGSAPGVRLLPSGDPYYLLHHADRELLVPDAARRSELWTPRVWPGALLVGAEIVGTWRRSGAVVVVTPWRALLPLERQAVEQEAASLPLPDTRVERTVRWER